MSELRKSIIAIVKSNPGCNISKAINPYGLRVPQRTLMGRYGIVHQMIKIGLLRNTATGNTYRLFAN